MEPRARTTRRIETADAVPVVPRRPRGGCLSAREAPALARRVAPRALDASAHAAARAHDGAPVAAAPPVVETPTPARAAPSGAELAALLVGSPREVLARIVPGDPLGVRDAVAGVLRAQCVFLDADRVHLRALARIARAALRFAAGGPASGAASSAPATATADEAATPLARWLRDEVAGAVAELLREELEAPRADPGSAFEQFARPLSLDPEALRRGCAAFNRLPAEDRAAFFALVLHDVGLDALARRTGETPSELGRRARRGLDAVLHASHPDLPPPVRAATTPTRPEGRR